MRSLVCLGVLVVVGCSERAPPPAKPKPKTLTVGITQEPDTLLAPLKAMRASLRKILVFLFVVLALVLIFGSLLYLIEGDESGFTSIGVSCYWAITTLTTVGYGDISPQSPLGRAVASIIMILGYGVIAVPTGIVTAELVAPIKGQVSTQACPECGGEKHSYDAIFCKHCGANLDSDTP